MRINHDLKPKVQFLGLNPEGKYTYIVKNTAYQIDPDDVDKMHELFPGDPFIKEIFTDALQKNLEQGYFQKRQNLKLNHLLGGLSDAL